MVGRGNIDSVGRGRIDHLVEGREPLHVRGEAIGRPRTFYHGDEFDIFARSNGRQNPSRCKPAQATNRQFEAFLIIVERRKAPWLRLWVAIVPPGISDDPIASFTFLKACNIRRDFVDGSLASLTRRPGDVRGHDEVWQPGIDDRIGGGRWFLSKNVDSGAGNRIAFQGINERLRVDEPAAGRIDENGIRTHSFECIGIDEILRLGI